MLQLDDPDPPMCLDIGALPLPVALAQLPLPVAIALRFRIHPLISIRRMKYDPNHTTLLPVALA